MDSYDFCGWASRNDLKCSDGRVIKRDAFKDCNGKVVPLVWNHQHNEPTNILGHALLENRPEGVFAYGKFNSSESGQNAKILVDNGDIVSMSIFANQLKQDGCNVLHGVIREVSLVLAGANPGAFIQSVIKHSDSSEEEVILYTGEDIDIYHAETEEENSDSSKDEGASINHAEEENSDSSKDESDSITHAEEENVDGNKETEGENKTPETEETVADVFNTLTDKQKDAVYFMIGQAADNGNSENSEDKNENNKEDNNMKHNVFDKDQENKENVLSHDAMTTIIADAKRFGSMKESVLQHAEEYGINQIDYLIPEAKSTTAIPEFIKRETGWVTEVMGSVHRTPFSRIKSIFADITEDDARAKGYFKGKLKKEEVFSLLKRSTTPTTVYKKQKMDRDDVIDITDFDVIAWLKSEMRRMLDEELARAILVGDGRLASSDDKINEQNIRPVWKDEELYTIQNVITVTGTATADDKAKAFIRAAIKSRKDYKGSGTPTLYTTEDFLTDMLLLTDTTGRDLYESVDKLATKLRVRKIVTVPVMEGLTDSDGNSLMGIIVNLNDYNVGADKGGAINMFDDFDIDYNQQKYLIETRCSGALVKPYSAIALKMKVSG